MNPAVEMFGGVGSTVSNNLIHDAPESAIIYGGNDHLIQYNMIHHVVQETWDAGAIYSGRDWGDRGTVIRYNIIEHLSSSQDPGVTYAVNGIYLDDGSSGKNIYGNIFYDIAGNGVLLGGGRDNIFNNNVFKNCHSAFWMDFRLNSLGASYLQWLRIFNYTQPPWSTKYPALATILNEGLTEAEKPKGNVISGNIAYCNTWLIEDGVAQYMTFTNNLTNTDPLFVAEPDNLQLQDNSPAYTIPGFQRIPVESIGMQSNPDQLSHTCADAWTYGQGSNPDFNQDCRVGFKDFAAFAQQWLSCNNPGITGCL